MQSLDLFRHNAKSLAGSTKMSKDFVKPKFEVGLETLVCANH